MTPQAILQLILLRSTARRERTRAQKCFEFEPVPRQRVSFSTLPTSQSAGIDAKLTRHILLAHSQRATLLDDLLREALSFSKEWGMAGVRSSRKLEVVCRDQLSFLWLTGWQHPDHNTFWRFY